MPEIGHIVYGYQSIENRIGETTFLCSTQEHCTENYEEGLAESLEDICYEGIEEIDGEDVPSYDSTKAKDLIVWEMKRIR